MVAPIASAIGIEWESLCVSRRQRAHDISYRGARVVGEGSGCVYYSVHMQIRALREASGKPRQVKRACLDPSASSSLLRTWRPVCVAPSYQLQLYIDMPVGHVPYDVRDNGVGPFARASGS